MTGRILAVYLIHKGGLLLGSPTAEGLITADKNQLVGQLEAIIQSIVDG